MVPHLSLQARPLASPRLLLPSQQSPAESKAGAKRGAAVPRVKERARARAETAGRGSGDAVRKPAKRDSLDSITDDAPAAHAPPKPGGKAPVRSKTRVAAAANSAGAVALKRRSSAPADTSRVSEEAPNGPPVHPPHDHEENLEDLASAPPPPPHPLPPPLRDA